MKSSTLLAGFLALLIACGVSFGAGYYIAKGQFSESPTPRPLISDASDDRPSLDGDPLETPEKPKSEPAKAENSTTETDTPDVTPKPDGGAQPTVEAGKPVTDRPIAPPPEPAAKPGDPKNLKDEIKDLKDKLKEFEGVDPADFEDIFNGPQVDFTATVSGQVVDQAGTAVAGASVHASYSENYSSGEGNRVSFVMARSDSERGAAIATTDASGSFSATITRKISEKASLQVAMTAIADNFAESEKSSFTLKNGDDKQGIKLALRGAGSVSGRVIDASGRGVSGVKVGLNAAGAGSFYGGDTLDIDFGGGTSKYSATTDAAGEFNIEGVAEGRYKFRLSGAGYRQISGPTEIDIKAGETLRAPADFQVAVTASVNAKFTSGDGRVIPGWVTLAFKDDSGKIVKRLSGQVSSDGSFEKNDPPVGSFDVEITVYGFKPQTVRATVLEAQRYEFGTIVLEPSDDEGGTSIILPEEE